MKQQWGETRFRLAWPEAEGAMSQALLMRYDRNRFPFDDILAEILQVPSLAEMHAVILNLQRGLGRRNELLSDDNYLLRERLNKIPDDAPFYEQYRLFVEQELAMTLGERIAYTAHPTFRVHMHGTPSVSTWHRDIDVTGRRDQVTVWIPLVDVGGSNSVWVESHYERGDYAPISIRHGELLLFDSGGLMHGSVYNNSGVTRVSLDFRISSDQSDTSWLFNQILGLQPKLLSPEPPKVTSKQLAMLAAPQ